VIIPGRVIKLEFNLGFKVERRVNLYFRQAVEDMVLNGEISILSSYESLRKHNITADFLFVNLDRVLSNDFKLPPVESFIMSIHDFVKGLSITDVKALNLDTSSVIEEKVPILIQPKQSERIHRIVE
jgi:KUP system potassium uptake protein